jgi:hypothetical protein
MQLRTAKLCLDCEEIHDAQQCPVCASESFAFIERWVPAPERRTRARASTAPPAAAVYKELLTPVDRGPQSVRFLKRGAVGIAAVGLLGWLWRQRGQSKTPPTSD